MSGLIALWRWLALCVRRASLRARIGQLQALLDRPDLMLHSEALPRALYEAKLAELRCELYSLEEQP